ncbi:hypothetical protein ACSBR2_031632 [Camellia fascicularis]
MGTEREREKKRKKVSLFDVVDENSNSNSKFISGAVHGNSNRWNGMGGFTLRGITRYWRRGRPCLFGTRNKISCNP